MADDVVQFVGQREAESLAGPQCLTGQEGAEHQRAAGDDIEAVNATAWQRAPVIPGSLTSVH